MAYVLVCFRCLSLSWVRPIGIRVVDVNVVLAWVLFDSVGVGVGVLVGALVGVDVGVGIGVLVGVLAIVGVSVAHAVVCHDVPSRSTRRP